MKFRKKKEQGRRPIARGISRNAPVNTYYRPKNVSSKSPDLLKDSNLDSGRRKFTVHRFVNIVIVLSVIVMVCFATTLSTSANLRLVDGSYNYRAESEYIMTAKEILSGSLTNQSKLLFRSFRFEEEMKLRYPEISSISAVVPLGGRKLNIKISVTAPLAYVSNGQTSGVINETGLLITDNVASENLLKVRFASPQENFVSGARLFTSSEVSLFKLINAEIPNIELSNGNSLNIKEILFNVADGQLEVDLEGAEYIVKISTFTDPEEQVGALKATLDYLDQQGQAPEKYIDVRVPGRTFVL